MVNVTKSAFLIITIVSAIVAEPFTIGLAGTVIFGIGSLVFHQRRSISCLFSECCIPHTESMPFNITNLERELKTNLHGQHLVEHVLLRHLKNHMFNKNPSRALLLSFNGMPGTGKNYVSTMIANSLFKRGMKSKYVHLFLSSIDFPLSKNVDEYKKTLQNHIKEAVKKCPYSLFIFDEVHDMPENLLDSIKPFVDVHESIDGVDYRKTIFILLSNSGGRDINTKVIETFREGRKRDSLSYQELEDVIERNLFAMKNDGLRKSKLISHSLISAFVPFLPLEKRHVRLCIKNLLKSRSMENDENLIEEIIKTLNFDISTGLQLALQGCKRIEAKINLIL